MICCSATMSVISIAKVSASSLLYINEAGGHSRERVCESRREERGERREGRGEMREGGGRQCDSEVKLKFVVSKSV